MVDSALLLAQNLEVEKLITLSGTILCTDSSMGTLSQVNIFNKNRAIGTVSDEKGAFSISMGRNDTIYFTTIQHIDQVYFMDTQTVFENHQIEVTMKSDLIWLKTVNILGKGNWNAFEQEMINLDLPFDDISIATPIINQYSRNYASYKAGDISTLTGPLTYLYNKFNRLEKLRKNSIPLKKY